MVTLSDCAQKGVCFGALTFVVEATLQFKTIKHPLINSVANMTGVTLANYVVKGDHFSGNFFKDWKESSKNTVSIALAFFLSVSSLRLAKRFDNTIAPMESKSSTLLWLFCYKTTSANHL